MTPVGGTVAESESRLRFTGIWGAPLVVLFAVWLWLAFSSGGFIKDHWLLPSAVLGFFGLIVALLVAYPRRPRPLSFAVLTLFGCYGVWVAFSALWADSVTRTWLESGRTFSYLLVLALALVYLSDKSARRFFRYLVMAGALVLLVTCLAKLGLADTDGIAGLFIDKRFSYPVSYSNNAAALFLVTFWPLMWLAAGPEERAPVRGVALGLATGLLGLAIMTQSRGAIWSLAITMLFTFVMSPARLRTLLYLLVPALLVVYVFPNLNRYWLEGPAAVGGALGVRTLAAASIIAGLLGLILALLEKWVGVSRRMKVIFGTIVLLGALGGIVYGSMELTRDVGGPVKWVSQTWRQFTGQAAEAPRAKGASRFTMVYSTGRVGIWKVALRELETAPVVGVGADNFVFQYDRLRTTETYKPKQAHSFELQVLGETGVVGGVFAFGGILLAAGGLLWPRCASGWRGVRTRWLRKRNRTYSTESAGTSTRWGDDPLIYGWELALLAGCAYWLIHASVDWLWQMAGVSIPAVLLLAAGVAGVDARAGILRPRVSKSSRAMRPQTTTSPQRWDEASVTAGLVSLDAPADYESFLVTEHRADRYAGRIGRRQRRAAKRRRSFERAQPPGPLSHVFRLLLVALSLVVIVFAGLPYVSLQYQNSARALADQDAFRAAKRAEAARWLSFGDPEPYETQASIYRMLAAETLVHDDPDRAGAVLDALALAFGSCEKAVALEPADWSLQKAAGVAAIDLLLATGYVEGWTAGLTDDDLSGSPTGARDWSGLAGLQQAAPGVATGSVARDETTLAEVKYYRSLSRDRLVEIALGFLRAADERNPLASQIDLDMQDLTVIARAMDEDTP